MQFSAGRFAGTSVRLIRSLGAVVVLGVVASVAGLWLMVSGTLTGPRSNQRTNGDAPVNKDDSSERSLLVREERYASGQLKARKSSVREEPGRESLEGRMQEWYEDGQLRLQGQWRKGAMDGEWAAWHANGESWVHGSYEAGRPIGEWNYWDTHGTLCGRRTDGVKVGRWVERNEQLRVVATGDYEKGEREGVWTFVDFEAAPLMKIEFHQGMPSGQVTIDKSLPMEFHYDEGRELPNKRKFICEGKTYSADNSQFADVLRRMSPPDFSALRWFAADGPFDPPVVDVQSELWPNGKMKAKVEGRLTLMGTRIVWLPHGKATAWYASGALQEEQQFFNGLEDGQFVRWYPNGKRQFAVGYQYGQPAGHWTFWYSSGKARAEGFVEAGSRFYDWRFWEPDGSSTSVANIGLRAQQLLHETPAEQTPELSPAK